MQSTLAVRGKSVRRSPNQKDPQSATLSILPSSVAYITPSEDEEYDGQNRLILNLFDKDKRPLFCLWVTGVGIDDQCCSDDYPNPIFSSCCALAECGNVNMGVANSDSTYLISDYYEYEQEYGVSKEVPQNPYRFADLYRSLEQGAPSPQDFLDRMKPAMRTRLADLILSVMRAAGMPNNIVFSVPTNQQDRRDNCTFLLTDNATNMRKGPVILSNDGKREIQMYVWSHRLPARARK